MMSVPYKYILFLGIDSTMKNEIDSAQLPDSSEIGHLK